MELPEYTLQRAAGAASHRLLHTKWSEPWKGGGIGASSPTPFQGLELTFATHRWLAPPANFHGASGAQPTDAVTTLDTYNSRFGNAIFSETLFRCRQQLPVNRAFASHSEAATGRNFSPPLPELESFSNTRRARRPLRVAERERHGHQDESDTRTD